MYSFSSNTCWSSHPVMNTCLISGSVSRASFPKMSVLTGILRRCIKVNPSFSISSIMILRIAECCFSSFGKKTSPVPYLPFSGTGMPCSKINSCGICNRMPAPSPVLLSAPSAPRCRMFSNILRADSTIPCDLPPWTFTTSPTPQASCSLAGSYNPCLLLKWLLTFIIC